MTSKERYKNQNYLVFDEKAKVNSVPLLAHQLVIK